MERNGRRASSSCVRIQFGVITMTGKENGDAKQSLKIFDLRASGQGTWNVLGCLSSAISSRNEANI